ncbi:MAG TPA: right-handed parallel beta-helix repeat-containing protein [Nocardioides sp.]|uniref:right-handed parallel beta-helix repeat-containing protein n=1 Tax=Nocardioides sp. TaxID=35761 RepID=UPI002E323830|nr:right-handed parallel beta-helix repeat-containing protein [Nocardioides sp.]HEX5088334.1 right-handed parallel beta-helix repeat-containing protein [Nocardioides sp.]
MLRPLTALTLTVAALTVAPAASSYTGPTSYAGTASRDAVHRVVGHGTPASCSAKAFRRAVAKGGTITFDCGPDPVTIVMDRQAEVHNTSAKVVIDGGGKVTLSGGGKTRILYQNTCDKRLTWTTSHCNDQSTPKLVLRNLTFTHGNSTGSTVDGGGGGAVFVRGGRLSVVNSTFTRNRCDKTGPDLGGAAIRVLDQFRDKPVKITHSTFTGGRCSNGSGLSSIGVSWTVTDSVFRNNKALGRGANPAQAGTPGGGSGGAIYLDGNRFTLRLVRTTIEDNVAREGGGAVFFVSNDRTGTLVIQDSRLHHNPSLGFETYPGIFYLGHGDPDFSGSTID